MIPNLQLTRMVERIFSHLNLKGFEISLVFCDNEWIEALNEKYMGRSGPTNVISFPMDQETPKVKDEKWRMLGDVVINVQRACDDANDAGIEPLLEVAFLVIHGICHLAGFDHEGKQSHRAKEMEEVEERIFNQLGHLLLEE